MVHLLLYNKSCLDRNFESNHISLKFYRTILKEIWQKGTIVQSGNFFILIILFASISLCFPQNHFYIPLNFMNAYGNDTRSYDGEPGEKYWQNRADYKIEVELNPANRTIYGNERIDYQNNSPDYLRNLYLKLYQDLYKIGTMRDLIVDSSDIHQGTVIHYMTINGDSIILSGPESPILRSASILRLKLDDPLPPGKNCIIELGWESILPGISRFRMGAYGDSAFFVGHWFPRVAVYDDIDGWDTYPYTGNQEFYNDFGNFDVDITVPDDFIVWATGQLKNMDEVLDDKYIERFKKASASDTVVHIVTSADYLNGPIPIRNQKNVWRYSASYVPDFAFATSNCYLWDATSLVVDKDINKRVVVDAAYRKTSTEFYEVARIGKESIKYLSSELPGYPFPYPKLTVFNGSGGMEYPMIVNDGTTSTRFRTYELTAHEITHTYFPFFVGTNEKKYAWMDEGWADMLIFDLLNRQSGREDEIRSEVRRYLRISGEEMDLPMMIPSVFMRGSIYRNSAYCRPSIAYNLLREIMGNEKFKNALHLYMDRWKGKHPGPYDFFFSFDNVYGENLNWFWIPWFFRRGYADLAIKDVKTEDTRTEVIIEKVGSLPIPIKIKIVYSDESTEFITFPATVWKDNDVEYRFKPEQDKEIMRIEIGDDHIPDINKDNNIYQNP